MHSRSGEPSWRSRRPVRHNEVVELAIIDGGTQDLDGIEVINRDLEKFLNLRRMKVQGDDAVGTKRRDGIGTDAGPDGDARLVLLVAFGIIEIRDDGGHRLGARPLESVDPEQDFHEVVVFREHGGLDDVRPPAAHVFSNLDEEIPFGKTDHFAVIRRYTQVSADSFPQHTAPTSTKDHHFVGRYCSLLGQSQASL